MINILSSLKSTADWPLLGLGFVPNTVGTTLYIYSEFRNRNLNDGNKLVCTMNLPFTTRMVKNLNSN